MSRSPSRDRSTSRATRTLPAATGGGGGGGGDTSYPTTLTGKALWLRAKDLGTGSVTTWTNAASVASDPVTSGTAPTIATASTPSSGKSVRFAGASILTLPNIGGRGSATATSTFAAGYEAPNAIDGSTGTVWASATLPATWTVELTEAETIASYRIYPSGNSGQQPAAWTFQGSNDGSTWTTLDTRTGQSPTGSAWNSYTFSNSTAYKVYRFNFTLSTGAGIVNIYEFELGGVANTTTQTMEVWAVVKSDGNGTFQGIWHLGGDSGTGASYYPYSGGSTVYEGAFLDDAIGTSYTHSMSVTSWRLYRVANNGTTWQAWLDGTSQLTRSGQPATYSKAPLLGKNRAGWFFNGNIAEILVRRTISTTQEVADLKTYFNSEHGLTVT